MIKTKNGKTIFKGTRSDIEVDFVCTIDSYKKALTEEFNMSEEEAIEHIKHNVELALMPMDELHKKAKEKIAKILSDVVKDLESEKEGGQDNE